MAAAQAMAWGLPGVSFDLESLKTYYPKGMLKSKINNTQDFADNIIKLLNNPDLYRKTSQEALNLIKKHWTWEKRTQHILKKIQ
jgi:glycosyltransferase involved in cell wall biosynthesis